MSWKTDQFLPSERAVHSLIIEVIAPLLAQYEQDVKTSMAATCAVVLYDKKCTSYMVDPSGILTVRPEAIRGNIRIWFRKTLGEGQGMYYVEAIYRGVAEKTGFSGFSFKGRLRLGEKDLILPPEAICTRYNVWTWRGPH